MNKSCKNCSEGKSGECLYTTKTIDEFEEEVAEDLAKDCPFYKSNPPE